MSDDEQEGRDEELGDPGGAADSGQPVEPSESAPSEPPSPPAGDPAADDSGLETGESGSLGLTEEFARIEAEIENDLASPIEDTVAAPAPEPTGTEPTGTGPTETELTETEKGAESRAPDPTEAQEGVEPTETVPDAEPAEAGFEEAGSEEWVADDGEADIDAAADDGEADIDAAADGGEADATEVVDAGGLDESDTDDAAGAAEPEAPAEEPTVVAPAPMPRPVAQDAADQHPIVKPMPRSVVPIAAAVAEEDLEDKTPSLWWRFLLGSVLIVASVATSVSVALLLFVSDIAESLQPIPGVQKQLASVESDKPQTILIVGSDKRSDAPKGAKGLSDTTMLLRVDPDKGVLSLFSLPRDLKVDIPGVGVRKLNEAYAAGGSKKTLETVRAFTGIEINHIVEINFQAFADAVNAVGCVYIDVDRDYFNSNEGVPVSEHYSEIDINSGYQRLCGLKALQFVRYRHTDTDLVRAARQQDFLREARQKVQPRELYPGLGGSGNELIDIFTTHVDSDIDNAADVIGILKSFIAVRNVPVNEVHFQGDIGGPDDPFVTSTDTQVEQAVDEFYNGGGSSGFRGGDDSNKSKRQQREQDKTAEKKEKKETAAANVIDADPQFTKYAGTADRRLNFPIFYPTKMVPGSEFNRGTRTYEYDNEDDKREAAYKYVIALNNPSTLIEYYGVMGTTWSDPPIMRNPSEVREIDGRDYLLFYDGGRLRMVGWKLRGNSYWLSNTLAQSIGEAEMLEIATSMKEL